MSTIEKCLNPKCKKDGNAAFEGYCSKRCKMESKARNLTPEEVAQRQAEIDARDLMDTRLNPAAVSNTSPECPAPNNMTIQQAEAIRAQKISDILNNKGKGGRNSKRMRKNKKSRKSRRRNGKNKLRKY